MDRHKPVQETPSKVGVPVDAKGFLIKHPLRCGQAESLLAMTAEFTFFTPAPLYLHGRFPDTSLIDLIYEWQLADFKIYFKKFNKPIFRGLEAANNSKDWNHVLWAVRKEHWRPLVDFICAVTLTDSVSRELFQFGMQELCVLDPLAMDRAVLYRADLPTLWIGAFGVNASKFRAAFVSGQNPLTEVPRLCFYAPDRSVQVFEAALFSGKNPIHAREQFRNEPERPS